MNDLKEEEKMEEQEDDNDYYSKSNPGRDYESLMKNYKSG